MCSAEAACVWLDPCCSITSHLEAEFLSSGCVLCMCESAPGHHHTDTLINHWSLRLVLVLDIAGRSDDSSSSWSSEIWRRKSFVLFECKASSAYLLRWLVKTCVFVCMFVWCPHALMLFFFCVGVSAFVREGRGKRKKNRNSEGREKCSVCGWYLRFTEWNKPLYNPNSKKVGLPSKTLIKQKVIIS